MSYVILVSLKSDERLIKEQPMNILNTNNGDIKMADQQEMEMVTHVVRTQLRKYQDFYGSNKASMQRLITGQDKDGNQIDVPRELITPNQLITVRLHGKAGDKKEYRGKYVDTDLAVIPNPSGDEIKFVHRHPLVRTLNKDTKLANGAMPITQDHYDDNDGFVLTGDQAKQLRENPYALPDIRRDCWKFALGDEDLMKDYEADICDSLSLDFNEVMGLYVPSTAGLRLLCVGSVGDFDRSFADGDDYLGGFGRLVGVARDAPEEPLRGAQRDTSSDYSTRPDLEAVMTEMSKLKLFGSKALDAVRERLAPMYNE